MPVGPTELLIVFAVLLLLFGSTRLPALARALGQATREFKEGRADEPAAAPPSTATKTRRLKA